MAEMMIQPSPRVLWDQLICSGRWPSQVCRSDGLKHSSSMSEIAVVEFMKLDRTNFTFCLLDQSSKLVATPDTMSNSSFHFRYAGCLLSALLYSIA